jgi:signal transduction histidine kinase
MPRTLRGRLVGSHVLLLLIVIPLVGVALVYVLETQVLLVNLAKQLTGQAVLVAELARAEPAVWSDTRRASAFVDRVSPLFPAQLELLSPEGVVLASSDPVENALQGRRVDLPGLDEAIAGQRSARSHYSQNLLAEVSDVMVPVVGADGQIQGIIRLTDHLGNVFERFLRLRLLIAGVLASGLLLGGLVGLALALTVERPLHRLTEAVDSLAIGDESLGVPEQGPLETRHLHRAFERLLARLQEVEQRRRNEEASLVHELGRPLGALRAATRALQDGAVEDVALRQELLVGMQAEFQRLEHLVIDLSELHDRSDSTRPLDREPIALEQWLPELLAPWREAAMSQGLTWRAELAPDLPTLRLDPDRLGQALGNILSNAVKFTPAGGSVTIASGVTVDSWWFQVDDTGPGIPEEDQAHAFEPFFRSSRRRAYPHGLGLGLTIAGDLVEAHGGEIQLTSTPGAGTSCLVRLPLDGAATSMRPN